MTTTQYKRPSRLYYSFLVALVPTLLLSLIQISRLSRLEASKSEEQASGLPITRVAPRKEIYSSPVVQVEPNQIRPKQETGKRYAVVSFLDSMDYYLWGVYSIHTQLRKVNMTPHIRHVALVAQDMKSKHKSLVREWLGEENVWEINKSTIRKQVPKGNQLWGAVFSKLEFFNLTMFDKVIAIDNDILIRKNIEHWFDFPAPAATQARGEIEWNSGAMVVEPDSALFEKLLEYMSKMRLWKPKLDDGVDTWNSGDGHQGFLSAFFTSNVTTHEMFTMRYACSMLSSDLEDKFENQYYWKYRNDAIETIHLTKHKPWKDKTETKKEATCGALREWAESVKDAPVDRMPKLPDYLRRCPPVDGESKDSAAIDDIMEQEAISESSTEENVEKDEALG